MPVLVDLGVFLGPVRAGPYGLFMSRYTWRGGLRLLVCSESCHLAGHMYQNAAFPL
jgi:hypothetical protein